MVSGKKHSHDLTDAPSATSIASSLYMVQSHDHTTISLVSANKATSILDNLVPEDYNEQMLENDFRELEEAQRGASHRDGVARMPLAKIRQKKEIKTGMCSSDLLLLVCQRRSLFAAEKVTRTLKQICPPFS